MSFDLHIECETSDDDRLRQIGELLGDQPIELLSLAPGHTRLSVGFPAGTRDAVVRRVYEVVVGAAKVEGWRLHDPQAGVAIDLAKPKGFPPGWEPALTLAGVRKLTKKGHYPELLAQLHRIEKLDATDRDGNKLLDLVLLDAWAKGPTCRSYDGRLLTRAAEDVALALIERGADPHRRSKSGRPTLYYAVVTDSLRLASIVLGGLSESDRRAVLREKFRSGTLLDEARSMRSKKMEALLRAAGAT
ncbi:MAG: hypothetical protein SangKO_040470 [Sandaracinaceae bacterium]